MKKLTALIAGGLGYVLGARAGRQRFEQLRQAALRVQSNPKVQQAAGAAKGKAPVLKEKVTDAASKVKGSNESTTSSSTSTAPPTTATTTAPLSPTDPITASTTSTSSPMTPSSPSGAPLSPPPA